MDYKVFEIADFTTQGSTVCSLKLAYKTIGQLNSKKDNVILVLTSYAAQHDEAESLVAGIDLSDYYIVLINMFCNGLSSSPSNTPPPYDGPRFPDLTIHDNVQCQKDLLDHLDIHSLRLVMGYSMGGLQTFEWGSQFPHMVNAILPICGAAKVSPHNYLFLDGAKAALCADQSYADGEYESQPTSGLLAFSRVYAGWMFSQTFFREEVFKQMGMSSIEDVVNLAEGYFMRRDANDLLGMIWTWQHADISQNQKYDGNFVEALAAINAKAIIMPGSTDLYFTVADNELEQKNMTNAELRPILSPFGHVAGSGMDPAGKEAIDKAVAELLLSNNV
ncbi:MAG: homoserine O-acetyltransferase [Granulosicoccus sp.]|jgi:homoserine O-acetyltransferase